MQQLVYKPCLLAAAVVLAGASPLAPAQNALGDGRALDANPGQHGTSNPRVPTIMDEIRFRNSIATGNAPGGMSFRGDVGYRAPGEFTGQLGSDSLFAFRRDSLYSGLAGMGLRGTDALQYQFALTTGASPPRNLIGNLSYTRDDLYASSELSNQLPGARGERAVGRDRTIGYDPQVEELDLRGRALSVPTHDIVGYDGGGSMLGTLRSPSTYTTTATLQPSLMSVYEQGVDRRPYGLVASPLLGVTSTPLLDEDQRPANPLVSRPGETRSGADPREDRGYQPARIRTSYDDLVREMHQRAETMRETRADASAPTDPTMTTDQWLIQQMEDLRQKLYGAKPANEDAPDDRAPSEADPGQSGPSQDPAQAQPGDGDEQAPELPPIVSIPDNADSPLRESIEERRRRLRQQDQDGVQLHDPTEIAIDRETREMLRGSAANEVEQLLDPGADKRNVYAEHINAGEELIVRGRYFDAEERFTHALSIRPRDVTAQIGRLHAQIGAGMLLSASVNLQALFTDHPELITTKYGDKLLPGAERIEQLFVRLRERSGIERPEREARGLESEPVRVAAATLLAYLGYQSENQQAIRQGLGLVRELGADSDRRFASLLGQLWLDDEPTAREDDPQEPDADD